MLMVFIIRVKSTSNLNHFVYILKSNGTHFLYKNSIQGDVDPRKGLISRQRKIQLGFCCEYPLNHSVSMNVDINPVER